MDIRLFALIVLEKIKDFGIKRKTKMGDHKRHCIFCNNSFAAYAPLSAYYRACERFYGHSGKPHMEFINIKEWRCPYCGALDRDRAYAVWMKKRLIMMKR